MKLIRLLSACTAIVCASLFASLAVADPADYVFKLDMPGKDGFSTGSAVLIAPGLALTAEHCRVEEGAQVHKPAAAVSLFDPVKNGVDEAQLLQVGVDSPHLVIGDTPNVGDSVVAYGYPAGQFKQYTGTVQGFIDDKYIVTSFMPEGGASGGGLFNAHGELIGICSARDELNRTGHYIHTNSIRSAIAQHTQSQFQRPTRVVVLSLKGCGPCERLRRDVSAGKFPPNFQFEFVTFDDDLGVYDNADLHAEFVAECNPPKNVGVPVIWIPGTGKYQSGYDAKPDSLCERIKTFFRGPAPTVPAGTPGLFRNPGESQKTLLAEIQQLKEELSATKSHVDKALDGGLVTKAMMASTLKDDKRKIEESVASIRSQVDGIRENPAAALCTIIIGIVTGVGHGFVRRS